MAWFKDTANASMVAPSYRNPPWRWSAGWHRIRGNTDRCAWEVLDRKRFSEVSGSLASLYDSNQRPKPVVVYAFLVLSYAVTVPALFLPDISEVLGGIEPRHYPWQRFTAVFVHGWPGFPALVHLGLNTFLMLECGRPCERLLGSGRFLVLSVAALAASAAIMSLGDGVNGSSLVIWAWGPPLFVALRAAGRGAGDPGAARIRAILVVMYGVVTLAMTLIPYAAGWRGNPLTAFLLGNQYHLVATAVGVVAALTFSRRIHSRIGPSRG